MPSDPPALDDLLEFARRLGAAAPSGVGDDASLQVLLGLLDGHGIGAFVCEDDTAATAPRFLHANAHLLHRLGYELEDLLALDLAAVTDAPAPAPGHPESASTHLHAGDAWPYRTRFGARGAAPVQVWETAFRGRPALCVVLCAAEPVQGAGLIAWAADGLVTAFDEGASRLLGLPADAVRGTHVQSLMPAATRAREFAYLAAALAAGHPLAGYRCLLLGRGGRRVAVTLDASPLHLPSAEAAGAAAVLRAAPVAAAPGAAVAPMATEWSWEQDETLRYTRHAGEAGALAGWMRVPLTGRTLEELPLRWVSEQARREYRLTLARHEPFLDMELQAWDSQGRLHWLRSSGQPCFDAGGRFRGYRGVDRDITAERTLAQALRAARAQVTLSAQPCLGWAPDGRILSANAAAADLLGYTPEALAGLHLPAVLPAAANPAGTPLTQPMDAVHVNLRRQDGRLLEATVRSVALQAPDGMAEGWVGVFRVDAALAVANDARLDPRPELAALGVGVWDWELVGGAVRYDAACAALLGVDPAQLQAHTQPWSGQVHPDDAHEFDAALAAAVAAAGPGQLDIQVRLRAGPDAWRRVRLRASRIGARHDDHRAHLRGLCEAQDDPVAVAPTDTLDAALESLAVPLLRVDAAGAVLWRNAAARSAVNHPGLPLGALLPEAVLRPVTLPEADGQPPRWQVQLATTGQPGQWLALLEAHRPVPAEASRPASTALASSPQAVAAWDTQGRVVVWNSAAEALMGVPAADIIGHPARVQPAASAAPGDTSALPAHLLACLPDGILVLEPDGAVSYANDAARQLFGWHETPCAQMDLARRVSSPELLHVAGPGEAAAWARRLAGGRREVTARRSDGTTFPAELMVAGSALPGPEPLLLLVRDISDRRYWENQSAWLAYTDPQTGLPNRMLLGDRLQHALHGAQRNRCMVAVLAVDLPGLCPPVAGQLADMELVREAVLRMRGALREIDTVARVGTQRFVVVLTQVRDGAAAESVAHKLLDALGAPAPATGQAPALRPTLGISVAPRDGNSPDALLASADQALLQALDQGQPLARSFSGQASAS